MKHIVVTGATGLIGRHLLGELSTQHRICALTRRADSPDVANVSWLRHDLTLPYLPDDSLPADTDTVIHLAQSPHFREFPEQASHVFDVNVGSTFRLIDWARKAGVKRFIYASSGGIYGYGNREFSEDDPVINKGPLGFYLASKRSAEFLVENYTDYLHVIILRFFFVYGSGQRPHMLIPRLVRSVLEGKPIHLQGEDGIRINPVHVGDVVRAIMRCLSLEESHKINVAGPEVLTLREIGNIIGRYLGRAPIFQVDEGAQPNHLIGNTKKMTELLGPPQVRLADGVVELCREA